MCVCVVENILSSPHPPNLRYVGELSKSQHRGQLHSLVAEWCFPPLPEEGGRWQWAVSPHMPVGVGEGFVGWTSLPRRWERALFFPLQGVPLHYFLSLFLPQPFPSVLQHVSISHWMGGKMEGREGQGPGEGKKGRKMTKYKISLNFPSSLPVLDNWLVHPLCARCSSRIF